MVQINFALREVNCKIVYYGPGLSGKTTNLEMIHQKVPQTHRGDLTSIATEGDRTLFFDFMPLDLGKVAGMTTRFQLYTVPGQVYYNATRKLVLQGADGIVFVADSQEGKMEENIESFNNLEENLKEYGVELSKTPCVMQYNKRDLPNVIPIAELESKLNRYKWPYFEAVAITGEGVFPTLKKLASIVLENLNKEYGVRRPAAVVTPTTPKKEVPVSVAASPIPTPTPTPTPPLRPTAPPPQPRPTPVTPVPPRVAPPTPAPAAAGLKSPSPPTPIRPSAPAFRPQPAPTEEPVPVEVQEREPVAVGVRQEIRPQPGALPPLRKEKASSRVIPVQRVEQPKIAVPTAQKGGGGGIVLAIILFFVGIVAGMAIEHFAKILEKLLGGK